MKKNDTKNINVVINGKKILDDMDRANDRIKTSLYLSESLFKRFRIALGKRSASQAIESLMLEFVQAVESIERKG